MKQLLFIFIFNFFALSTFAQSVNKQIEEKFLTYSQLVIDKNIDKALDYTNPELFEIVPRDQMKNLMEMVFNMPGIEYKTTMPTIVDFEEVKNIDKINYVRFKSISSIEMKFSDITEADKIENVTKSFEAKYGKENVSYDDKTSFFKINTTKVVVASAQKNSSDWKFVIVDNPKMKTLLEKFIPKELLD